MTTDTIELHPGTGSISNIMARNTSYALFDQIIDRVDGWGYIKSKMPEIPNGLGTDRFYQILYDET
jgi:hypothetical protein